MCTMAQQLYVSIEATRQGRLKGESQSRGEKGRIAGVRFTMETVSPRDVATGQASGKRQHKPILLTKEWGAASPQLYAALVANEVLKSVVFEFVKTDARGQETVFHRITLTNAAVSGVKSYLDLTDTSGGPFDGRTLEDVSFVYQKVAIENLEGKTSAVDDWHT
jgi:type VI secretion system secreted protein Hcp